MWASGGIHELPRSRQGWCGVVTFFTHGSKTNPLGSRLVHSIHCALRSSQLVVVTPGISCEVDIPRGFDCLDGYIPAVIHPG